MKKYQMPFVIAAETAGEIQCLMELLKDEDIQLTIVDGFEFGDAIEELKEKKVGIIFGNFSNLSQISKHEIDLSRLKELVEKKVQKGYAAEEIAEMLEEDIEVIHEIMKKL